MAKVNEVEELERRAFQCLMLSSRVGTMEMKGQLIAKADVPMGT